MARRRVRRRNPGVDSGAGDAELLLTVAAIGAGVWLLWGVVQGTKAAIAAGASGLQSLEQGIEAPFTTLQSWWSGAAAPSIDLSTGDIGTPTPGSTTYDLSTGQPTQ